MKAEEYNRLWPIIHGRLSEEEKMFWAETAALNIKTTEMRAQRAEMRAQRLELRKVMWRRLAILFGAFGLILLALR